MLPKLNLQGVAAELQGAAFVVSVDTGLGHLSAALNRPTVALYGPTSPNLVGTYGANQRHLLAEEGVELDSEGRIDLARYRWRP